MHGPRFWLQPPGPPRASSFGARPTSPPDTLDGSSSTTRAPDRKHIRYAASRDNLACAGTPIVADDFVPFVAGELGIALPGKVEYLWLSSDDNAGVGCPESTSGCTKGSRLSYAMDPLLLHELVHNVAAESKMNGLPFFTEGLATAYDPLSRFSGSRDISGLVTLEAGHYFVRMHAYGHETPLVGVSLTPVEWRRAARRRLTTRAGRWSMVDGRWSMVDGRWSMVDGRWSMVDGRWSMVDGAHARVNPVMRGHVYRQQKLEAQ